MSRDRRSERRLTFRGGYAPSCSPDSRQIAFVRSGELYTIASSGKQQRHLTLSGGAYYTAYSPDGHEIALLVAHLDQYGLDDYALVVVNLRGRRVRPNTRINGGGSAGIGWQPLASRPRTRCVVPDVLGLALATASTRLEAAHCSTGSVSLEASPVRQPGNARSSPMTRS